MRMPLHDLAVLRRVRLVGPAGEAQADLLLDTGATLTTLSKSVLEAAGYDLNQTEGTRRIVTENGVVELPVIRVHELRIDELEVTDLLVVVHDIPEVAHVEGLIGVNCLRQFRIVFDFPGRSLEIT